MSETTDSTSLQGLHSVAERLKVAGFKQTGIARAVWEYIESLFWARSDISPRLMNAIKSANERQGALLGDKIVPSASVVSITQNLNKNMPVNNLDYVPEESKKAA